MFHLRTTPLKYSTQTLRKLKVKQKSAFNWSLTFLKLKLVKWSKNDFPPESWESIGMKFDGLSNLFGLIDYFLTVSVSSAKAERGFSILKSLKPSKRAVLTNQHLQGQMLVTVDRLEIESFEPHKSINYWYKRSTSKHRNGKARAK